MRSDPIDRLVSQYVKQPVKLHWRGTGAEWVRGSFEDPRLELSGVATEWLNFDRVVLRARRLQLRPGVPAHAEVERPTLEIAFGQDEVDHWLERSQLPFSLELGAKGLRLHTRLAGIPISELEARLEIVRGWFVLQPRRASLLGVPAYVVSLFRTYLPLPPLSEDARMIAIGHEEGRVSVTFEVDDFDEALTPGLAGRLRRRVLPFT